MTIITDNIELAEFCHKLSNSGFITVDTEFIRERTYYPKLCLIQISGPDKDARAIDPLVDGIDLSPLFDLFRNENIVKVFHAARQDLEIFYNITNTVAAPIFDTQIAAMVCGHGDSIGYEKLVKSVSGEQIDKSSQFTDWALRPLSDKQLQYALGDVTYLCDIYLHLKEELNKHGRTSWVLQEKKVLINPETYNNDPYKAWERIKIRSPKPKNLAILRELAALREKQAQKKDIPRNWVIRDDILADIANQAPTNKKQLAKIRNFSKEMTEGKLADNILKAIEIALESPKDTWPAPEKKQPLAPNVMVIIDILKMLLKIQSSEHGVAHKILASSEDIEAIALDDNADVPALKGWRREVFGEDAIALKHGKIAIGLKDGKISKIPVE